MAAKMAAPCRFALVETYFLIYQPISSKLHVWITSSKSFPRLTVDDNQDGCTE